MLKSNIKPETIIIGMSFGTSDKNPKTDTPITINMKQIV
jgi:hypothetical protein